MIENIALIAEQKWRKNNMTREEEIKELEGALRTVMNPLRDYDLELEAEIMIDEGWRNK